MKKGQSLIKTIFGLDNPFIRACERVLDLVILNLIFVLTCLPIVTIGLAKISLYATVKELWQLERLPILATYLSYFKQYRKQGLQLGLIELLVSALAMFNLNLVAGQLSFLPQAIKVLSMAILFLTVICFLYAYPLVSQEALGLKELLTKSFLLASLNLPRTLLMIGSLLLVTLCCLSSGLALLLGLTILLLAGFALLALGAYLLLEPVLLTNLTLDDRGLRK